MILTAQLLPMSKIETTSTTVCREIPEQRTKASKQDQNLLPEANGLRNAIEPVSKFVAADVRRRDLPFSKISASYVGDYPGFGFLKASRETPCSACFG